MDRNRATPTLHPSELPPTWQIPRIDRRRALIGGVCGAIATEVGVPVLWVRLAFGLLTLAGGWGLLLYIIAWVLLTWADLDGFASQRPPTPKAANPTWRAVGFWSIVAGAILLFANLPGLRFGFIVGLTAVGAGFALVRRSFNADLSPARSNLWTIAYLMSGFGLIAAGAMVTVASALGSGAPTMIVALAIALCLAVVAASSPWWWGLFQRFDAERQARIRADERAAVGAQLHDSVLQTLALIQNQTDPAVSAQLARRQERELRNWFEPDRLSRQGLSLKGQLDALAVDIEELYSIRVETVIVGDALLDSAVEAIVAATREAVVNAAKHSGVTEVDVYAEVAEDSVEVFVRDRGIGFEVDRTPDGFGMRESIRGRLTRVGGRVTITAAPNDGTEVELYVPREASA